MEAAAIPPPASLRFTFPHLPPSPSSSFTFPHFSLTCALLSLTHHNFFQPIHQLSLSDPFLNFTISLPAQLRSRLVLVESMSGFQDPEKLAAARELAQSFSKIKDPKKKSGGGGGGGGGGHQPRYEQWEPYPPQHHGHHAQFAPQQYWQDAGPPISSVPPPSQRMYASTTSFSTGRTGKVSVIGNAGLDFIKEAGIRPQGTYKSLLCCWRIVESGSRRY